MRQCLVILRGAPASGKTTLGEKLRNKEQKIVWLKIDNLKPFFSEDGGDSLDEVNSIALAIIDRLLTDGFSVVFDGIFKNPEHASQEKVNINNLMFAISSRRAISSSAYLIAMSK